MATETLLPSCQPDCKIRGRSMRCISITRFKTFSVVDGALTCLVLINFLLRSIERKFTDILLCGQRIRDILQPFGLFEYLMICLTFSPCSLVMASRYDKRQPNVKAVFWKFLQDCGSVLMHLIFLTILITLLKLNFGEDQITRRHYNPLWCSYPLPLNMDTSFRSFRSSLYSFVLTFIYLYIDRIDTTRIRSAQQLVVIVLGCYVCNKMVGVWENGDSQLADILVGAAIGVIYGAISIRSIFGTVFRTFVELRV